MRSRVWVLKSTTVSPLPWSKSLQPRLGGIFKRFCPIPNDHSIANVHSLELVWEVKCSNRLLGRLSWLGTSLSTTLNRHSRIKWVSIIAGLRWVSKHAAHTVFWSVRDGIRPDVGIRWSVTQTRLEGVSQHAMPSWMRPRLRCLYCILPHEMSVLLHQHGKEYVFTLAVSG